MNRIFRFLVDVPSGLVKSTLKNLLGRNNISISPYCAIAPSAELTIERDAEVTIQKRFRMRSGAHLIVRKGGKLFIGENTSINHNCFVVCHENIIIGNDVQFSPNVLVYDHDHDYLTEGGIKAMKYKNAPVIIGDNVWIGANTVILRGTEIGDNVIIGAGSIVKGRIPTGSVYYQKRETTIRTIQKDQK